MKKILFACAALLPALICSGHAHAVDSTAFDPTRVRVQAQNAIPVGTIIAWHATGNPADMRNPDGTYNWLECNGQSVSRTVPGRLFSDAYFLRVKLCFFNQCMNSCSEKNIS